MRQHGRRQTNEKKSIGKRGRVEGLLEVTASGRAFVARGDAYEDVMVAAADVGGGVDGDTVEVETWPGRNGREQGAVVRVITRGRKHVSGILEGPPWCLEAPDPRLPPVDVDIASWEGRPPRGQVVLGDIVQYPTRAGQPIQVRLNQVLGPPEHLKTEIARVLLAESIGEGFPPEVLREVAHTALNIDAELPHRVDLRHLSFLTIDPVDARDFDDAVALEKIGPGQTRVWVAIADVAHYVREGTALDEEARRRACSVYLPDRAIPMLPERLSSDLCSLVPEQDRLAMVTTMDFDDKGKLLQSECCNAIIRSRARLDYTGVAAALGGDFSGKYSRYVPWKSALQDLYGVAQILGKKRRQRGSLNLDMPEARVVLDEDDPQRVRDVRLSRNTPMVQAAYNLIEEYMLATNEAVAQMFQRWEQPTIWRIHEPPDREACEQLAQWMNGYGIVVDAEMLVRPKGMNRLLSKVAEHPARVPLYFLCLRTLKQARYFQENRGHFGLASEAYLHFTSPIRRYPDLISQRAVKLRLRDNKRPKTTRGKDSQEEEQLAAMAVQSSQRERTAMQVERRVQAIYAAALMREQIGEELEGQIFSFASFGMFVRLNQPVVEGLIKYDTLPEWVEIDLNRQCVRGKRVTYALGDTVRVRVEGASLSRGQLDFVLVAHHPASEGVRPTHHPGARRDDKKRQQKGHNKHERREKRDKKKRRRR